MSKKLYIYGIILMAIYCFFIVNYAYSYFIGGKMSFNFITEKSMEGSDISDYEMLNLTLIPTDDKDLFPSSIKNEKTGENMLFMINKGMVYFGEKIEQLPAGLNIAQSFVGLFIMLLEIVIFFYIPVKSFSIFRAVSKNNFYNQKNFKNLRKISYAILILFACSAVMQIINGLVARFYLDLNDYDILLMDIDYVFLILGLVLLIMSEMLLYTTSIKEENEYTI